MIVDAASRYEPGWYGTFNHTHTISTGTGGQWKYPYQPNYSTTTIPETSGSHPWGQYWLDKLQERNPEMSEVEKVMSKRREKKIARLIDDLEKEIGENDRWLRWYWEKGDDIQWAACARQDDGSWTQTWGHCHAKDTDTLIGQIVERIMDGWSYPEAILK